MTLERAKEIANNHVTLPVNTITWIEMDDGTHLHVMTCREPDYYENDPYVTYIDLEEENGDAIETHTAHCNDTEAIAFWVHELCYDKQEA